MFLVEWAGKLLASVIGIWFAANLVFSILPGVEFGDISPLAAVTMAVVCWIFMAAGLLRWLRNFFRGRR